MFISVLTIVHILVSVGLITSVVFQHRKQSAAAGIFGGGTVADRSGKRKKIDEFFAKLTTGLAITFMALSLLIVLTWKA